MEHSRNRRKTIIVLWGVLMNKRFFIHKITVYHFEDDENVTKMPFEQVYFRHNKKANLIDKRA